ncbi:MAG: ATP synthase F0 subunit C [Lachnospiraceae bacterium]|nr:ATP synthase F0 subunit C [Lachnospiraceae bacterium]MBR1674133.1 ATP synthase F0 subunit C [Eubacterium sp.]
MTTKNDKTEKAVVKTESAQLDDSVRSVDTTTVKDTETVAVEEEKADNSTGMKAIAAAIVVGIAAAAGAIGMGMAISKSAEGISRQPEAAGNIRTSLMLGLVFIETAIIYALIVAILIIFVM